MKTFGDAGVADDLLRRLQRLQPGTPRRWGRMNAHQMICHVRDAFLMDTDAKRVRPRGSVLRQAVMRWVALYVPLKWPRGIPTFAEVDQLQGGTRPRDFDQDVAALCAVLEQARAPEFFRGRRHPALGRLSEREWHRWAWLHTDHHLRQFGI